MPPSSPRTCRKSKEFSGRGDLPAQFRGASDSPRRAVVRRMPRPLRVASGVVLQRVGVLPVRGDIDTWLGCTVKPGNALSMGQQAGFTEGVVHGPEFEVLPERVPVVYWLLGRKPFRAVHCAVPWTAAPPRVSQCPITCGLHRRAERASSLVIGSNRPSPGSNGAGGRDVNVGSSRVQGARPKRHSGRPNESPRWRSGPARRTSRQSTSRILRTSGCATSRRSTTSTGSSHRQRSLRTPDDLHFGVGRFLGVADPVAMRSPIVLSMFAVGHRPLQDRWGDPWPRYPTTLDRARPVGCHPVISWTRVPPAPQSSSSRCSMYAAWTISPSASHFSE